MPPAEALAAHETEHPRPDRIRLGRITVTAHRPNGGPNDHDTRYVKCDDKSYGEWVVFHAKSLLQPYAGIIRLKAVDGVVYQEIGFTGWSPLADARWSKDSRYFPVGHDGLPVGFAPEADDAQDSAANGRVL